MDDLNRIILLVESELQQAEKSAGNWSDDPSSYHRKHRAAMAVVAASLTESVGAKINDRWDGAKVRIAGISASSTSGIRGALQNWLVGARKRLEAEAA